MEKKEYKFRKNYEKPSFIGNSILIKLILYIFLINLITIGLIYYFLEDNYNFKFFLISIKINYKNLIKGVILTINLILIPYFYYKLKNDKDCIKLIEFTVWKGDNTEYEFTNEEIIETTKKAIEEGDSLNFQLRMFKAVFEQMDEPTMFPKFFHKFPINQSSEASREEFSDIFIPTIDELFKITNIKPKDIDVLITTCSLFCPTPSMTSMIINHYKMRTNIRSYHLGGMGCSSGMIGVELAQNLLKTKPGLCLIFSSENITKNWYIGKEKSMTIPNILFRVGGAAILLSNKGHWGRYILKTNIRSHLGSNDESYNCIYRTEDEENILGVRLSREIPKVAGKALKIHLNELGRKILPLLEKLKYLFTKKTPNFKKSINHFCIHAGGRKVLDSIQQQLNLSDFDMEPSRLTLKHCGNTSVSSVWYEFECLEALNRLKKWNIIWQLGFGSGFKVCSSIWKKL